MADPTVPAEESGAPGEQLALLRRRLRGTRRSGPPALAAREPVARVAVDVPLAHLDRPFDYAVTADQDAVAVPGARVRVRFAGRAVDGFLLERRATSDHVGPLVRLARVVSPEPVLDPAVARLARAVADRYAGTLADVLRLAVPPRHARAESAAPPAPPGPLPALGPAEDPDPWGGHPAAAAFRRHLARPAAGRPGPRAAWAAPPGRPWPAAVADLVRTTVAAGRGALVVVPDAAAVALVEPALARVLGVGRHVVLSADQGAERRYRTFLAVRRGQVPVVLGTRSAAFAPVRDLGLAVLWDDGDDLLAEPRAPYPHTREVLALRAHQTGCGLLFGGHARTAEVARLLDTGWLAALDPDRSAVRAAAPLVRATGRVEEQARDPAARTARLPHLAWSVAHDGLRSGPVLVQTPRRGYLPRLACQRCRAPARCPGCAGPLQVLAGHAVAICGWCGRPAADWSCSACGGRRIRAVTVGSGRTAEELGRAFPGVRVLISDGSGALVRVPDEPALVVATPGAEPPAERGYAAALLLDGGLVLARPDLRAGEEAVRRWLNAAALVRSGQPVALVADSEARPVQAVVRWDPAGFAERELADRTAAGLPPGVRMAQVTGDPDAVAGLLAAADWPPGTAVLGPVPAPDRPPGADRHRGVAAGPDAVRALVRAPVPAGTALAAALAAALAGRSARRDPGHVEVRLDPVALG